MVGEARARHCHSNNHNEQNKYVPHSNTSRNPDRMQSPAPLSLKLAHRIPYEIRLPCQSPQPSRATAKCGLEQLRETQFIAEEDSGQAGWVALTPLWVSDSLRS